MLTRLSFEVFVTVTETVDQNMVELSTKAFTKLSPQTVSEMVSVVPIHLFKGEAVSEFIKCRELKLTVVCDDPRYTWERLNNSLANSIHNLQVDDVQYYH